MPRLVAWVQGELVFAEADEFVASFGWHLTDHPALLQEGDFGIRRRLTAFRSISTESA